MKLLKLISKRKLTLDIILLLLLIALSSYAWRFLPQQFIRGGDYQYLTSSMHSWWLGRPLTFTGFQTSAALSGIIFSKLFGTNMLFYFGIELLAILLIAALFYILVRIISKSRFVAFSASLIVAVNYFGNFDMFYSYTRFSERVIVVPLLLLSFIFLQLFLERSKTKNLIRSLVFYFFGIGLAHFNLIFTAPYLLYPIFFYFFKNIKEIRKGIITGSFYLGLSMFFVIIQQINESGFSGKSSFLEYLLHPQKYHYLSDMLRQLVYWSQYPPLIDAVLNGHTNNLQNAPSVVNAIAITPFIAVIYIFASIYLYKKLAKQRHVLFTVVFSIPVIFYLNSWFGQYIIPQQVGANRYLYFPTFLLAIFWSFFLGAALWTNKSWKLLIIAIFILMIYYHINLTLLEDSFSQLAWVNEPTKKIIEYLIKMRKNFPKNTLVIGQYPAIGTYEAIFYTEQVGKGEIMFKSESDPYDDWRGVASTSAHIVKLTYDEKCECTREEKLK